MIITIKNIPEGRSTLSQVVKIEGEQAQWIVCKDGLSCRAEIDSIEEQISVHVFYQGSVELECSRCIEHFKYPISGDFYVLLKKKPLEKKNENPFEDDIDFYFDDKTEDIDIGSAIFDDIITALPMKPVCSENCKGIAFFAPAAQKTAQAIEENSIDSRWDGLKKFKK